MGREGAGIDSMYWKEFYNSSLKLNVPVPEDFQAEVVEKLWKGTRQMVSKPDCAVESAGNLQKICIPWPLYRFN